MLSTLSPDGRWLGHRRASDLRDPAYLLRDIATGDVVSSDGTPIMWSSDGRFLVLTGDDGLSLLEPGTGSHRELPRSDLLAVLPDGSVLSHDSLPAAARAARLPTDPATPSGPTLTTPAGARDPTRDSSRFLIS